MALVTYTSVAALRWAERNLPEKDKTPPSRYTQVVRPLSGAALAAAQERMMQRRFARQRAAVKLPPAAIATQRKIVEGTEGRIPTKTDIRLGLAKWNQITGKYEWVKPKQGEDFAKLFPGQVTTAINPPDVTNEKKELALKVDPQAAANWLDKLFNWINRVLSS